MTVLRCGKELLKSLFAFEVQRTTKNGILKIVGQKQFIKFKKLDFGAFFLNLSGSLKKVFCKTFEEV